MPVRVFEHGREQGDLERAGELFGNLLVTVPGRVGPTVRSTDVFTADQDASADGV